MQPMEMPIPGDAEWAGYENDLDAKYAHGKLFGTSIEQAQRLFGETEILARAEDLHFMPRGAFQYYVFAFSQFLLSDRAAGEPDAASAFLQLLIARELEESGCVSDLYAKLKPTVEFVAAHQSHFDADLDIYGSFPELSERLRSLCERGGGDA
jgi:hypothetical protein